MVDIVPQPEEPQSLRDRIADIILAQDTMVRDGGDPRADALGLADALIAHGVTIASYRYGMHLANQPTYIIDRDTRFADGPATHRQAREGKWEPLEPGDEHEPDCVIFGTLP